MSDDTTAVETESSEESVETKDTLLTGDTTTESTEDTTSSEDAGTNEDGTGEDTGKEGSDEQTDTYTDFAMPEGMELDKTALDEVGPLFKELGLNQEQAQKLIDVYAKQVQVGSQQQVNEFNQLMNDWQSQSKNDNEFGGDKFDENLKTAQNAINKYGTPELTQLLEEQGVGNHPEVIRFMVRVGQTLSEDNPGSTGGLSSDTPDRVEVLYGKQKT